MRSSSQRIAAGREMWFTVDVAAERQECALYTRIGRKRSQLIWSQSCIGAKNCSGWLQSKDSGAANVLLGVPDMFVRISF